MEAPEEQSSLSLISIWEVGRWRELSRKVDWRRGPERFCDTEGQRRSEKDSRRATDMDISIQIPDEVGRALMARGADVTRAVLEAVAIEAYRSGAITPQQVKDMLGLRSRWETEAFLRRGEAYHHYTHDNLDRDIAAIRDASRQ